MNTNFPSFSPATDLVLRGFAPVTETIKTAILATPTDDPVNKALSVERIRNLIMSYCDFPQLKILQRVSKTSVLAANQKEQLQSLATRLGIGNFNEIDNYIKDLKEPTNERFYLSEWCHCWYQMGVKFISDELSDEIKKLVSSNTIEDINKYVRVCKSRDAIVFWNALEDGAGNLSSKSVKEAPQFHQIGSIDELFTKAGGLQNWCQKYKEVISQRISLRLSNCGLISLPVEIAHLTQLKYLHISNNQLTSLPPEIGQCVQLQMLDVSSNRLASLPPEIGQCVQLQVLYIGGNRLASLPPEIGQCVQLKYLDVKGNQLTFLPPEIGQCVQLQSLFVDGNQLTFLPDEIGKLSQLVALSVANNQLTSLPDAIGGCVQLEMLSVSNNKLTFLPDAIGGCVKLETLFISNNKLTSLPVKFVLPTNTNLWGNWHLY